MNAPAVSMTCQRRSWPEIIEEAARIVRSYDTGVTLRQLFYRLVSSGLIPNNRSSYTQLSSTTAKARRARSFPALIDRGRVIHRYQTFGSPAEAIRDTRSCYRRDRTEGQEVSIYLGVEKNGIVEQLQSWFGGLGVPILALGGYSSQTYADDVRDDIAAEVRPAVLIYAGDFDPSGEDIDRDFLKRVQGFDEVRRIALNIEQIEQYDLPEMDGKQTDSRASGFVAKHGRLVQVELDALDPEVLRGLYQGAIDELWDSDAYDAILKIEAQERASIGEAAL
jgi:hypothetical protein